VSLCVTVTSAGLLVSVTARVASAAGRDSVRTARVASAAGRDSVRTPTTAPRAVDDDSLRGRSGKLRAVLVRLLAIDDLMQVEDLEDVLALARRQLPRLFPDRSG
jgi:transcriptional regulator GlxA family with amidase domain